MVARVGALRAAGVPAAQLASGPIRIVANVLRLGAPSSSKVSVGRFSI
jgi:hypothetical protein